MKSDTMQSPELHISSRKTKGCVFCGSDNNDKLQLGDLLHCDDLYVHYYCMLLSSALEQHGASDEEGILGFLPEDILSEVRRGKRLKCFYCKRVGATLGCYNTRCKKAFHLPCGLENNTLHQFFGNFPSYCADHRPKQPVLSKTTGLELNSLCPICLSPVKNYVTHHTLYAPCCKNGWFHRSCIQKQALTTGYFFRCSLCNDIDTFQEEMHLCGIYIPEQDAAWELDQNAYEELLFRYCHCDASCCICPEGRQYNKNKSCWEVAVCKMCGSQGCHIACGDIPFSGEWNCESCMEISSKSSPLSRECKELLGCTRRNRKRGLSNSHMTAGTSEKNITKQKCHSTQSVSSDSINETKSTHKRTIIASVSSEQKSDVKIQLPSDVNEVSKDSLGQSHISSTFNDISPPYLHVITVHSQSDSKTVEGHNFKLNSVHDSPVKVSLLEQSNQEMSPEENDDSADCEIIDSSVAPQIKITETSIKRICATDDLSPSPKRHCRQISIIQNNADPSSGSKLSTTSHSGPCIKTLLKQPCDMCIKKEEDTCNTASEIQHFKSEKGFLSSKTLQNYKSKQFSDGKLYKTICHNRENKNPAETKSKRGKCTPLHCTCKNNISPVDKGLKNIKSKQNEIIQEKTQLSLLQLFKKMLK